MKKQKSRWVKAKRAFRVVEFILALFLLLMLLELILILANKPANTEIRVIQRPAPVVNLPAPVVVITNDAPKQEMAKTAMPTGMPPVAVQPEVRQGPAPRVTAPEQQIPPLLAFDNIRREFRRLLGNETPNDGGSIGVMHNNNNNGLAVNAPATNLPAITNQTNAASPALASSIIVKQQNIVLGTNGVRLSVPR